MPDDPAKDPPVLALFEAPLLLYFLTVCQFERETPVDPDAPIGWMPVFKSVAAARKYGRGNGQVGEIEFAGKGLMN